MPKAHVNGIDLYYEITGSGFPLALVHEFSGKYRDRCIPKKQIRGVRIGIR